MKSRLVQAEARESLLSTRLIARRWNSRLVCRSGLGRTIRLNTGWCKISVSARVDGAEVVLSVQDNGIGISRQSLPLIFDLFVQERQPGDRAPGGLGLGLTIVRSLVERHGGSVSATSDAPTTAASSRFAYRKAIGTCSAWRVSPSKESLYERSDEVPEMQNRNEGTAGR